MALADETSLPLSGTSTCREPERGKKIISDIIATAAPIEHDDHKGPHDPKEINPKMASDIAHWAKEFGVTGQLLHEAIRVHGTHVEKVRAALAHHDVSLT